MLGLYTALKKTVICSTAREYPPVTRHSCSTSFLFFYGYVYNIAKYDARAMKASYRTFQTYHWRDEAFATCCRSACLTASGKRALWPFVAGHAICVYHASPNSPVIQFSRFIEPFFSSTPSTNNGDQSSRKKKLAPRMHTSLVYAAKRCSQQNISRQIVSWNADA